MFNSHNISKFLYSIRSGFLVRYWASTKGAVNARSIITSMDTRWKPNVTVAAIIEKQGRYLLVEEHTLEGLRLNNPAGHLDPGESPAEGCARETLEETAHSFKPTALVGIYLSRFQRPATGEDITYVRMAFCGELGDLQAHRSLDEGIVRTVWMTPEEVRASAARHRSPLVLRCIEDHLKGQRYPLEVIYTDPAVYHPLA
jgi:ADP-ribose pyrophosphatase YjhB (NUDIX family)